jgi:hypothetical protein
LALNGFLAHCQTPPTPSLCCRWWLPPEPAIQRAVFDHLRQRGAPGTFAFHPPNGGWRSAIEAAILKGLGIVAGTPDVIVLKGGATYALELKAEGGRLSETQRATHAAMIAAGAVVGVAHGIDQAIAWLEGHKLLRGTMTTPTRSRP